MPIRKKNKHLRRADQSATRRRVKMAKGGKPKAR